MHKFPGGLTARVTPVPIPNTEVKPCRADDTALETTRERRSPPGLKSKKAPSNRSLFYFCPDFPIHCLNQLRATVAALWYEGAADTLSMVITSLELMRLRGSAARYTI